MNIIQLYEAEQIARLTASRGVPDFVPGDTVRVAVKVVEGERTRTQAFEGVCIARSNKGLNSNFTVRKISYGEGVERVFPLYSPLVAEIAVVRRGDVRRAKLYYLRGRSGKRARIAERARTAGPSGDAPSQPRTKPKPPTDRPNESRKTRHVRSKATHAVRQDLGQPRRGEAPGRDLHPLHRSASAARGDQPAGVRGPAHGRAASCAGRI